MNLFGQFRDFSKFPIDNKYPTRDVELVEFVEDSYTGATGLRVAVIKQKLYLTSVSSFSFAVKFQMRCDLKLLDIFGHLFNQTFPLQQAISEFSCASVSKRV